MPEAVIVDAARSPIGRAFKGSLAQLRPEETAAYIVDQLLERNPDVSPEIDRGRPLRLRHAPGPAGLQRRPDHLAALRAAAPEVTGTTISRYCASSLDAIRHAANAIKAGEGDAYVAAGVEFVSRFNERTEPARADDRNPNLIGENGQPNAYIDMGLTAVNVAKKYEVSRADMDKYAQRSQELAVASQEDGFFDREIVPVADQDGNEVAKDDGPRASSTLEKLSAARRGVRGRRRRHRRQLVPAQRRRRRGAGDVGHEGERARPGAEGAAGQRRDLGQRARVHGRRPDRRDRKVLDRAGMTIGDIDVVELNEAFAAQVIPIMAECDIPLEKMNTHGGAIALGHPFGMTGARIMTTLLNVMETDDHAVGLETMCVAGGQGEAMIVERIN